jgi:glucose-6-phosphate dehydrogenase assembly protein OpcA
VEAHLTSRIVSPAEIQNALNQIWESLETTNVTRACLFNLIFYTQKNHRISYIRKLAQKVIEKFPSRVIFVTADKTGIAPSLKTEVSILTSSQGQFDIACDYIQIEAMGSSVAQIPFVVLPHILPDLPVYLLLAEDPCQDDPLCHQLELLAHRLIFDSETTDNLPQFASNLLYEHKRLQLDIADLNWARLEGYRELLSMSFYTPERLHQIKRARSLSLTYNAQKTPFFCHTKIQAIYLQAWLATQLGWEFCTVSQIEGTLSFTYRGPSGPIDVTLSPLEVSALPPGLVLSIDIISADEEHFSFKHDLEKLHQITFNHSTKEKCDLPAHYLFSKAEGGHSLVQEICHRGTSQHFLNTLHLIEQMETAGLC